MPSSERCGQMLEDNGPRQLIDRKVVTDACGTSGKVLEVFVATAEFLSVLCLFIFLALEREIKTQNSKIRKSKQYKKYMKINCKI